MQATVTVRLTSSNPIVLLVQSEFADLGVTWVPVDLSAVKKEDKAKPVHSSKSPRAKTMPHSK